MHDYHSRVQRASVLKKCRRAQDSRASRLCEVPRCGNSEHIALPQSGAASPAQAGGSAPPRHCSELRVLKRHKAETISTLWQLANIPSTTERFDELNTRLHAPTEQIDSRAFVAQSNTLRRNHFQIGHQATLITV